MPIATPTRGSERSKCHLSVETKRDFRKLGEDTREQRPDSYPFASIQGDQVVGLPTQRSTRLRRRPNSMAIERVDAHLVRRQSHRTVQRESLLGKFLLDVQGGQLRDSSIRRPRDRAESFVDSTALLRVPTLSRRAPSASCAAKASPHGTAGRLVRRHLGRHPSMWSAVATSDLLD